MTIPIQRVGNELKIGRSYFKVSPHGRYPNLAMCDDAFHKVSFTQIRNVPVVEFPQLVEIAVNPDDQTYRHIEWLSIARLPRRTLFELVLIYPYCRWTGPGTLRDHLVGMIRALKSNRRLKAELYVEHGNSRVDELLRLEVSADCGVSGVLGDHYDALVHKLMSVHAAVAARAMTSMRAGILADHTSPVGARAAHRGQTKPLTCSVAIRVTKFSGLDGMVHQLDVATKYSTKHTKRRRGT